MSRVNRKDEWKLIGKQDPQLPQMFYPVANNLTLSKGDTVVRFEFSRNLSQFLILCFVNILYLPIFCVV